MGSLAIWTTNLSCLVLMSFGYSFSEMGWDSYDSYVIDDDDDDDDDDDGDDDISSPSCYNII